MVIGTSFIGMEVASYLSDKASSVECIDIAAVPFERVLGERIGKSLQQVLTNICLCLSSMDWYRFEDLNYS